MDGGPKNGTSISLWLFFLYIYMRCITSFFCELFEVTKLRFAICSWFVCTPFMVFDVPFRVLIFCMHCLLMVCFSYAQP